jgi:hypothetical protein
MSVGNSEPLIFSLLLSRFCISQCLVVSGGDFHTVQEEGEHIDYLVWRQVFCLCKAPVKTAQLAVKKTVSVCHFLKLPPLELCTFTSASTCVAHDKAAKISKLWAIMMCINSSGMAVKLQDNLNRELEQGKVRWLFCLAEIPILNASVWWSSVTQHQGAAFIDAWKSRPSRK